jgi:nucleotide-binding universal stress UspA family protein
MFGKILVAVDGSDASDRAASLAAELAARDGAEAIVFHVREWRSVGAGVMAVGGFGTVELEEPDDAAELVRLALKRFEAEGVTARAEVQEGVHGGVARQIVDFARAQQVGLIVMGSRGLSDLGGMVLGSVTHKALHHAECPVLAVR